MPSWPVGLDGCNRRSPLETGAQLPSEDDLRIWAQQTGASSAEAEALLDMLSTARGEYTSIADLLARGALAGRQAHIEAIEAAATPDRRVSAGVAPWLGTDPGLYPGRT